MPLVHWLDVIAFLGFAVLLLKYGDEMPRFIAGMVIAAVGLAFWITARIQLGDAFSIAANAKRLVTTGLYSRFRHPVYLLGIIAYAGLAVAW